MYGTLRTKTVGYKYFNRSVIPSRPYRYSPFYNLQGGINTFFPSHQIKDNEVADAFNVEYSSWGLKTRAGKAKYNSVELPASTSIRGLHVSYATGSRFILASGDTGKVYKDNGSGTFTEIATGYTADSWYYFHDWKAYTFWVNGQDTMKRYDGSNIDTMTNAPTGLIGMVNAESRLFAWKIDDNNLYFCDLNDETVWDVASEYSGFLVVPQVKGDYILACAKQGRSIIVFKSKSIWRYNLYGLPRNWTREMISESLGVAGRYAVDSIQDVIYFMGDDGRIYQLANNIKLVSQVIDSPDTSRWGLPTDMSMSDKGETILKYMPSKKSVRVIYNDRSATTDYPNKYADYSITRDAWVHGNLDAYNMEICDGRDDTGYMYVGDVASGYIYRIDTGTNDDGSAIESYIRTKDYSCGAVDIKKIFNTAYVSTYPAGAWNAELRQFIDYNPTGTGFNVSQSGGSAVWDTAVWDTDVWGGEGLVRSRVDLGNPSGYYTSFRMYTNTLDQWFEMRGIGLKYQMLEII